MPQKVLITGGAGFIGSKLALDLISKGHFVRVLDSLAEQVHGADPYASQLYRRIAGKVDFVLGSVTVRDDLARALTGIDTVVHLAAETGTGQSMYAIRHYSDVNIGGTALLLDMIANDRYPIQKIVVASSRAVYGEGRYRCGEHGIVFPHSRDPAKMKIGDFAVRCALCDTPATVETTDEDTPTRPSSVYGVTKLTQEQLVLTVGRSLGISAIALRYQNVYGPGQSLSNPYTGILSIFSTRIRNGRGINIFEDGKESRDFVYVDDVVAATASAVERDGIGVNVVNVGSGVATDVLTIAQLLQKLFGASVRVEVSGQFRVGDIRHNVADLARSRAILGFAPQVSMEAGLDRFVAWVKEEQVHTDRYEASLQELKAKGLLN